MRKKTGTRGYRPRDLQAEKEAEAWSIGVPSTREEDTQLRQAQQGPRDTLEHPFPLPMLLPKLSLDCGAIR